MRHLIATLLTLFPGLGLGYLILRRWQSFWLALIASGVTWGLLYWGFFVADRYPSVIFQFFPALPVIVLNLTLAHNLWSERYATTAEEAAEEERWYRIQAAPFFGKAFAILTIVVVGFLIYDLLTPRKEETPMELEERFVGRMEDHFDNHILSNRVRLIAEGDINFQFQSTRQADGDQPVELPIYRYRVAPGDYTLDLYLTLQSEATEVLQLARLLKQPGQNLIYMIGLQVFVLHTTNDDLLQALISDVSPTEVFDGRPCNSPVPEVCGYTL